MVNVTGVFDVTVCAPSRMSMVKLGGVMLRVAEATLLSSHPVLYAIALMVVVDVTEMALAYNVLASVGVLPSVV
jgi:hypothetical protein